MRGGHGIDGVADLALSATVQPAWLGQEGSLTILAIGTLVGLVLLAGGATCKDTRRCTDAGRYRLPASQLT